MTLIDLIKENKGVFVLYWYNAEDNLESEVCTPSIIDYRTVKLKDDIIVSMATRNLYCLVYEDVSSDIVYIFNKGVLTNVDGVFIESEDFQVDTGDKRMFFRYDLSTDLMLMNRRRHERVKLNNISYTGVNITTPIPLEMGEEVMLYDPSEIVPVYIPGEVVHKGEDNTYGVMISGNFDHINRVVIPKIM